LGRFQTCVKDENTVHEVVMHLPVCISPPDQLKFMCYIYVSMKGVVHFHNKMLDIPEIRIVDPHLAVGLWYTQPATYFTTLTRRMLY